MSSEQVCSATQHTNRGSTGDPWPIAVIVSTNLILLLLLGWVFVRFGSVERRGLAYAKGAPVDRGRSRTVFRHLGPGRV